MKCHTMDSKLLTFVRRLKKENHLNCLTILTRDSHNLSMRADKFNHLNVHRLIRLWVHYPKCCNFDLGLNWVSVLIAIMCFEKHFLPKIPFHL